MTQILSAMPCPFVAVTHKIKPWLDGGTGRQGFVCLSCHQTWAWKPLPTDTPDEEARTAMIRAVDFRTQNGIVELLQQTLLEDVVVDRPED